MKTSVKSAKSKKKKLINGKAKPHSNLLIGNGQVKLDGGISKIPNIKTRVSKISHVDELITPEVAAYYLSMNIGNRSIKTDRVSQYARLMTEGKWKEDNGDPLRFSKKGILLSGQHRLLAVIESGKSIWTDVARGFDDDITGVIDAGAARTVGDNLHQMGIKYSALKGSIIQVRNMILKEKLGYTNGGGSKRNTLTSPEVIEHYSKNSVLIDESTIATKKYGGKYPGLISPKLLGGWWSIFSEIDPIKCELFFDYLYDEIDGSPKVIRTLRQFLWKHLYADTRYSKMKTAHVYKAWNAFYEDKDTSVLSFKENESFPKISGLDKLK